MTQTAMDGRPDVDIRLRSIPAEDPRVPAQIVGEAECRFCPESLQSSDPRTLVKWADEHEHTVTHIETKREMQEGIPVAPPVAPSEAVPVSGYRVSTPLDTLLDEADLCDCHRPEMGQHNPECEVSKRRAARADLNRQAQSLNKSDTYPPLETSGDWANPGRHYGL